MKVFAPLFFANMYDNLERWTRKAREHRLQLYVFRMKSNLNESSRVVASCAEARFCRSESGVLTLLFEAISAVLLCAIVDQKRRITFLSLVPCTKRLGSSLEEVLVGEDENLEFALPS